MGTHVRHGYADDDDVCDDDDGNGDDDVIDGGGGYNECLISVRMQFLNTLFISLVVL